MNNDPTVRRLIELQEEISAISKPDGIRCNCDKYLEMKIRHFGGGKHYVRQCNSCGEQRGGSIKESAALNELAGQAARNFDVSICETAMQKARMRSDRFAPSSAEADRIHSALFGQEAFSSQEAIRNLKRDKATADISSSVDDLVKQFGIPVAVGFLIKETVRLKKNTRDELEKTVHRFNSEDDLKRWFEGQFAADFEIFHEVKGRHLAEGVTVRIDYLLKARQHLIDAGFDPSPFGVEVKFFNQRDSFTRRASRGLWQTISYNDCEFDLDGTLHKPKFSLIFSNLSFEDELQLINNFGREYENDKFEWRGMLHLANHANVGCLNVRGTRSQHRGWDMQFVGGTYFRCSIGKENTTHQVSNNHIINKQRIGNF